MPKKGVIMGSRRPNGEGTISQRKDGRWVCTLMIGYTAAGKRRFKSFYGKTQAEAKKKRNEFLRLMEAGMLVEKEYVFDEWADMWFENHKATEKELENQRNTKFVKL